MEMEKKIRILPKYIRPRPTQKNLPIIILQASSLNWVQSPFTSACCSSCTKKRKVNNGDIPGKHFVMPGLPKELIQKIQSFCSWQDPKKADKKITAFIIRFCRIFNITTAGMRFRFFSSDLDPAQLEKIRIRFRH